MMAKPLDGVRICDFTLHAAGPYGTQYLSLLGAECIKIESRMRLDIHRRPHPVYGRLEAAEFDQGNGNKLAIELNLRSAKGVALAKRLVALSEVVTENFRPGVIRRLGLDYEVLKPLRPGLVMASVSASGQTGPEWADPGYAPIFAAVGGLGHLTGYADGPPVELRNMMDNVTGLTMACAVWWPCTRRAVPARATMSMLPRARWPVPLLATPSLRHRRAYRWHARAMTCLTRRLTGFIRARVRIAGSPSVSMTIRDGAHCCRCWARPARWPTNGLSTVPRAG